MTMDGPLRGVFALSLRSGVAAWRMDSPGQRLLRLGVLGAGTAVNCALSLLLGRALANLHASPAYVPLVSGIVTTVAFAWIVPTILFGARFNVQLPLLNLLHLPITFRRLYVARVVTGMAGPWLALFLPPLAAVTWAGSRGTAHGVLGAGAILLFVLCLTEISTVLSIVLERWTSRWLGAVALFVLLAAAISVYFWLVAAGSVGEGGPIARMMRARGASPVAWVSAALPTGCFAGVVSADATGRALGAFAALVVWAVALMVASYHLLLSRLFRHPQLSAPRATGSRSLRLLLAWTKRRPCQGAAPHAALVAQALLGYARISNIRLLLLVGTPYCVAFPAFLHGKTMMAPFVYVMLWVPVMFLISVKSNLLGADPSAVRACFWYPVAAGVPIRAKLTAINLIESGLAVLMCATIAVMSPHVATIGNTWSVIVYWVSQIALTDALGAVSSVTAPKVVTWGRAAPSGNDPQIFAAGGLTGGLALAFTTVSVITAWLRIWWLLPVSGTAAMVALVLVRRVVLNNLLPRLLEDHRDRILAALPLGA